MGELPSRLLLWMVGGSPLLLAAVAKCNRSQDMEDNRRMPATVDDIDAVLRATPVFQKLLQGSESLITNRWSRIPSPESPVRGPESGLPSPGSRVLAPESWLPSPGSLVVCPGSSGPQPAIGEG